MRLKREKVRKKFVKMSIRQWKCEIALDRLIIIIITATAADVPVRMSCLKVRSRQISRRSGKTVK